MLIIGREIINIIEKMKVKKVRLDERSWNENWIKKWKKKWSWKGYGWKKIR